MRAKAEVGQLDGSVHAEQHVVAFDVSVHDVVLVQMAQGCKERKIVGDEEGNAIQGQRVEENEGKGREGEGEEEGKKEEEKEEVKKEEEEKEEEEEEKEEE